MPKVVKKEPDNLSNEKEQAAERQAIKLLAKGAVKSRGEWVSVTIDTDKTSSSVMQRIRYHITKEHGIEVRVRGDEYFAFVPKREN